MNSYYPFGLQFNSYKRVTATPNDYLYNQGAGEKQFKTERITALDLGVDMTKFRVYDPAIGRFWQEDPLADMEGQESWTPYQYAYNSPSNYNDPYGDCPTCISGAILGAITETVAQVGYNMVIERQNFSTALSNVDGTDVLVAAGTGFITGAIDGGASKFVSFMAKGRNRRVASKLIKKGIETLVETTENIAKDYFNDESIDITASLAGALVEVGMGDLLPSTKFAQRKINNANRGIKRLEKKISRGRNVERNTKKLKREKSQKKAYTNLKDAIEVVNGAAAENGGNAASNGTRYLKEVVITPDNEK